jgi:hypothetical protein
MNKLRSANGYDLNILQKWLVRPGGGNSFLRDIEGDPWDDEGREDLISVDQEQELDAFTNWLASKSVPWLHRVGLLRWKVREVDHSMFRVVDAKI